MADGTQWNPLDDIMRMKDDVRRLLGKNLGRREGWSLWGPSVDVRETQAHVIVRAELPGVHPDDIEIVVREERLVLKGEFKDEGLSRRHGSFHRVIPLPTTVKHAEAIAEMSNGILEVRIPKDDGPGSNSTMLRVGGTGKRPQ